MPRSWMVRERKEGRGSREPWLGGGHAGPSGWSSSRAPGGPLPDGRGQPRLRLSQAHKDVQELEQPLVRDDVERVA